MRNFKLNILFLLATVWSFAQVNLYSEVNTKEVRANNPLVFTIVLEIVGEDLIQETPVKLPDFSKFDFDISSEQNTVIDPVKKIRINQQIFQLYLEPKQAGNLRLGSAVVRVNGKWYKTEPIDILVKESDKKPLATNITPIKSMHLNMHIHDKEVYKNEPVVGVLKAFSKNISAFRHIEPNKVSNQKNTFVYPIKNIDEPIEEDDEFSSQVVAMYVFVPRVAGTIELPAVEASLGKSKRELISNKVKINVKKLPDGAPSNFKNAVGKFDVKFELINKKKEQFEINKAFNVSVKVSGKGDLNEMILPNLKPSKDYDTYKPKIINNSFASVKGLEGEIEAQYVIIPKKRGDIFISTENFSYFDPKLERYVDLGSKTIALKSMTPEDIASSKSTMQKVNDYTNTVLEKVDSPVISTENLKIKKDSDLSWRYIFGNLSLIFIGGLVLMYFNKKYKQHKAKLILNQEESNKPIVNIAETEALLRRKLDFDLDSHYNFLENIIDKRIEGNYFEAVENLLSDAENYCEANYSKSISRYLKDTSKLNELNVFNEMIDKIKVEKYSPFSSKEIQKEILNNLKTVLAIIR